MTKLSQIVSVETGVSSDFKRDFDNVRQLSHLDHVLNGFRRTYQKAHDDGDDYPSESARVQTTVPELNEQVRKLLTRLLDVTATKDWANTEARADLIVDGQILVPQVPATYLLWVEKRLDDLRNYLARLPVLDPADDWSFNDQQGFWETNAVETAKTRKVPKAMTLYAATPEHPAQVEKFNVDEVIGTWTMVKRSGAIPATERRRLVERVTRLIEAVRMARQQANTTDVEDVLVGKVLLDYVFA